jgi:hypothetical protein
MPYDSYDERLAYPFCLASLDSMSISRVRELEIEIMTSK